MHPFSPRRLAASRRMAQFFLHPRPVAHGPTLVRAGHRGESPVAALYENRFRCLDEVLLPQADCQARHEPLERYLGDSGHISASMLRRFARGEDVRGSGVPAGGLGEALHALLLEPRRFERDYCVPADVADEEALASRTWLTQRDYDRLRGMRDAILAYPLQPLAEWLDYGAREWSIYWSDAEHGRWKARPDCFTEDVVLEIKTTTDVRPHAFARARRRFLHDLQGAHYLEGIERLTGRSPRFLFVAVENVAPHYVWVHELEGPVLRAARAALDELRVRFLAATALRARQQASAR
jgi:hypothetical protein